MKRTRSIRLPKGINTFPQGESTEMVSVPASFLNQLLEEVQALREAVARLEAKQKHETLSSETNQDEDDDGPCKKASVTEPKQGNNAKIISLDTKKREDPHAIQVLKDDIIRLETSLDKDMERLAMDIAHDRQRLAKLEKKGPQPLQKDRGKILNALIMSSGGNILAKQARQVMHLDKATFSRLLATLSDLIIKKVYSLDRRQRVLLLS
jgi:hypothetical protein